MTKRQQVLALFSVTVTAASASTNLEFLGRQDPAYLLLDDVPVTSIAVPLPASVWLMLSGLVGVAVMARRRRAV